MHINAVRFIGLPKEKENIVLGGAASKLLGGRMGMIIDIHTRIGRHPIHGFKQEPETLLKIMEENDIAKSFLLPFPIMKIKENNDLIVKAVKENPDRLVGFAGIDPSDDDAQDELDRARARSGIK